MQLGPLSLLAFVFTVSAVHASSQFDLNCQRQADSKCPAGARHYSSDNSDMYYYQCMRVGWMSLNKVTKGCSSPTPGCKCVGGCLQAEKPEYHVGVDINHYCANACLIGAETPRSCA
ncbi:hypothetical protein CF319_g615 [Tilletia indica]|uniref:Uncharacterized protein n=1 Tax=Tilletia indica TaxID=43049 RepID=A0A177T785_9BASI|nr:hypothetical protein CF319_g615 [Tilletia indica]KAE8250680.1 hypothetical protein A4X13_0g4488 [Tilletia indica]